MDGKAKAVVGILMVILVVMIGGVVYAFITQQLPSVTIPPNGPQTVSNCSSANNETNPGPVEGAILFGCGPPPGTPAFIVNYPAQNTPTFALPHPQGGTAFLHYVASAGECMVTLNSGNMTTGSVIAFSTSGPFYYCETYYGYPLVGSTQTSFTVTWAP